MCAKHSDKPDDYSIVCSITAEAISNNVKYRTTLPINLTCIAEALQALKQVLVRLFPSRTSGHSIPQTLLHLGYEQGLHLLSSILLYLSKNHPDPVPLTAPPHLWYMDVLYRCIIFLSESFQYWNNHHCFRNLNLPPGSVINNTQS